MTDALTLVVLALPVALAAGWVLGMRVGKRRSASAVTTSQSPSEREVANAAATVARLRAQALEVAAEPVLIVGRDGKLRDCNAAALILLARHRAEVVHIDAAAVRTLVEPNGASLEWPELVGRRAPWSGDVHIRMPDGSRSVAAARVVPVFGDEGDVTAIVEVYRGDVPGTDPSADRFLRALENSHPLDDGDEPVDAARRELSLLSLAFSDLEKLVRQYELLLPAMRAEDPLSEAIAGLAAETSEMATSADVPRLLEEIPRILERLRVRVNALGGAVDGAQRVGASHSD